MDANKLKNHQKCALVTGSSNGIGEAIVLALAKLDYKLVVTGRSQADVERVAKLCLDLSPSKTKPLEIVADLAIEADVRRLFERSSEYFNDRLDLLVNNAGLGMPTDHSLIEECWQSFKCTMQVNLMAPAQLTLLAAPLLKRTAQMLNNELLESKQQQQHQTGSNDQEGKEHNVGAIPITTSIINIGSVAAFRPTQSLAAYGTSKMALNMYTECMACELAPLIRVNCINPGPVATKIIERAGFDLDQFRQICATIAPLKRLGESNEVAESVLFLADPLRAGYITGAQLNIDGGCVLTPVQWNSGELTPK